MKPRPDPPTETWCDAQQYASLSLEDKEAIAAAVEEYDNAVAAAKRKLADDVASITEGKL